MRKYRASREAGAESKTNDAGKVYDVRVPDSRGTLIDYLVSTGGCDEKKLNEIEDEETIQVNKKSLIIFHTCFFLSFSLM